MARVPSPSLSAQERGQAIELSTAGHKIFRQVFYHERYARALAGPGEVRNEEAPLL